MTTTMTMTTTTTNNDEDDDNDDDDGDDDDDDDTGIRSPSAGRHLAAAPPRSARAEAPAAPRTDDGAHHQTRDGLTMVAAVHMIVD